MSRRDAVLLAGRALALLFTVWALSDVSSLPERVIAYLHYANEATASSAATQYWRHYELIALGFLITRIIGFSLLAVWLRKGGSEVEELLLPSATEENSARA
jgi:hypothetical protein